MLFIIIVNWRAVCCKPWEIYRWPCFIGAEVWRNRKKKKGEGFNRLKISCTASKVFHLHLHLFCHLIFHSDASKGVNELNSRLHDSCSQDCGGTECIARVNQIEFVVEEVALGQLFLPVSIIPPMLHIHSLIYHDDV